MLHFNNLLYKNISSIFKKTQQELSLQVYGSTHRYKQRLLSPDRLLVIDIVKLCNTLHISISNFFTIEPIEHVNPNKDFYEIDVKDFTPITFNNYNIGKLYGKHSLIGRSTREEVSDKLGVATTTLYLWAKNQDQMPLKALLQVCNVFNLPLKTFLDDENTPLIEVPKDDEQYQSKEIMTEIRQLHAIVDQSHKEIKHLRNIIKQDYGTAPPSPSLSEEDSEYQILNKKYYALLQENAKLKEEIKSLRLKLQQIK